MRFLTYRKAGIEGLAIERDGSGRFYGLDRDQANYPGDLLTLIGKGQQALEAAADALGNGTALELDSLEILPPLPHPGKIICVGLNYHDHSAESGFEPPKDPTLFARFPSSLIGHQQALVCPQESVEFDYEAELAVIIGKAGRRINKEHALEHVSGYAIFNDASVRDYQLRTPQWTLGKNFDATGGFGPTFITADELPPGCKGLRIQTRLNGRVLQDANIDDLIFDVASLISLISQAMTLSPGDVIVTGTPGGVGLARKPPVWMKPGDTCEIEIDQLGILRNPVAVG